MAGMADGVAESTAADAMRAAADAMLALAQASVGVLAVVEALLVVAVAPELLVEVGLDCRGYQAGRRRGHQLDRRHQPGTISSSARDHTGDHLFLSGRDVTDCTQDSGGRGTDKTRTEGAVHEFLAGIYRDAIGGQR